MKIGFLPNVCGANISRLKKNQVSETICWFERSKIVIFKIIFDKKKTNWNIIKSISNKIDCNNQNKTNLNK